MYACAGPVVLLGLGIYEYWERSKIWSTLANELKPTANELDPKTNELSTEIPNQNTGMASWEIERENKRKKQLRKDTYNQIREIQKELQKINPDYQPDDGALQWREAGKNFAKHISNQLYGLQKEMRRINPDYRSQQAAPQDKDAESKSDNEVLHELQRALRKLNPDYEPGCGAIRTLFTLEEELRAISHAVIVSRRPPVKSTMKPLIKPDINSEDAVESLAAKFKDPELRQHYRSGWDYGFMRQYQKDDVREMVDDHMGIFGIKWPKEGNPFGTDDDDEI